MLWRPAKGNLCFAISALHVSRETEALFADAELREHKIEDFLDINGPGHTSQRPRREAQILSHEPIFHTKLFRFESALCERAPQMLQVPVQRERGSRNHARI